MNYHFVSDVIAGVFVGGIVAMYASALAHPNRGLLESHPKS
jgi:membrane-associated phospholipid phosphatase